MDIKVEFEIYKSRKRKQQKTITKLTSSSFYFKDLICKIHEDFDENNNSIATTNFEAWENGDITTWTSGGHT